LHWTIATVSFIWVLYASAILAVLCKAVALCEFRAWWI